MRLTTQTHFTPFLSSKSPSFVSLPFTIVRCVTTPSTPASLSPHRIVTSFLTLGPLLTSTTPSPNFRVALLHRSPSRPFYPSLWAACTGSVETSDPSSTAAALREIEEETGLYERELELLKPPKAWELLDQKLGKRWMAEVFLWRVTGGFLGDWAKDAEEWERGIRGLIRLNRKENTELRWVRLDEVEGLETVEGLGSSLRRVLEVGEWAEK